MNVNAYRTIDCDTVVVGVRLLAAENEKVPEPVQLTANTEVPLPLLITGVVVI